MLSPFEITCNANDMRGRIKHRWLWNLLLGTDKNVILNAMHQKNSWEYIDKELEISSRLNEAILFSDEIIAGFSPVQLIDKLSPFANLSKAQKAEIKRILNKIYLAQTTIVSIQTKYCEKLRVLQKAIEAFKKGWLLNDCNIDEKYETLQKCAKDLHSIMEGLPNGVVIP